MNRVTNQSGCIYWLKYWLVKLLRNPKQCWLYKYKYSISIHHAQHHIGGSVMLVLSAVFSWAFRNLADPCSSDPLPTLLLSTYVVGAWEYHIVKRPLHPTMAWPLNQSLEAAATMRSPRERSPRAVLHLRLAQGTSHQALLQRCWGFWYMVGDGKSESNGVYHA